MRRIGLVGMLLKVFQVTTPITALLSMTFAEPWMVLPRRRDVRSTTISSI